MAEGTHLTKKGIEFPGNNAILVDCEGELYYQNCRGKKYYFNDYCNRDYASCSYFIIFN